MYVYIILPTNELLNRLLYLLHLDTRIKFRFDKHSIYFFYYKCIVTGFLRISSIKREM